MKVALIHDYLIDYGGAERVLEALHEMYPEAPVYVAFVDKQKMGVHWQNFADWDIRETWMAKIPSPQHPQLSVVISTHWLLGQPAQDVWPKPVYLHTNNIRAFYQQAVWQEQTPAG